MWIRTFCFNLPRRHRGNDIKSHLIYDRYDEAAAPSRLEFPILASTARFYTPFDGDSSEVLIELVKDYKGFRRFKALFVKLRYSSILYRIRRTYLNWLQNVGVVRISMRDPVLLEATTVKSNQQIGNRSTTQHIGQFFLHLGSLVKQPRLTPYSSL